MNLLDRLYSDEDQLVADIKSGKRCLNGRLIDSEVNEPAIDLTVAEPVHQPLPQQLPLDFDSVG